MSLLILWSEIVGPSVEQRLVALFNQRLAQLKRESEQPAEPDGGPGPWPSFLGETRVTRVSLGNVEPDVELVNIAPVHGDFMAAVTPARARSRSPSPSRRRSPSPVGGWGGPLRRRRASTSPARSSTARSRSVASDASWEPWSDVPSGVGSSRGGDDAAAPAKAENPDRSVDDNADLQFHFRVAYDGSALDGKDRLKDRCGMSLTVETELVMPQLGGSLLALPIRLTVSALVFEAEVVVAHIAGPPPVICVSLVEIDAPGAVSAGVLQSLRVESRVGDPRQRVLVNVAKVERFLVDQLRALIAENFVWPSFYVIHLDSSLTKVSSAAPQGPGPLLSAFAHVLSSGASSFI